MATDTLRADSAPANLAPELRALEKRAGEYERAIRQTRAVLTVLWHSELVQEQLPHNGTLDEPLAAALVLDLVSENLKRLDGPDDLNLSGEIGSLAYDIERPKTGKPVVPGLSEWAEAVLAMKCGKTCSTLPTPNDEPEVDRVADLHHDALMKLLTIPAPDGQGLSRKLALYKEHNAYLFGEAKQIAEVLAADACRITGEARHG